MSVTHPTRGPLRSFSGCSTFTGRSGRGRVLRCHHVVPCACRFRHLPPLGMGGGVKPGHPSVTHSILAKVMCHLVCRAALKTFLGPGTRALAGLWLTERRRCLPSGPISAESSLHSTCFLVTEGRCLPEIEPSVSSAPLPWRLPIACAALSIQAGAVFPVSK